MTRLVLGHVMSDREYIIRFGVYIEYKGSVIIDPYIAMILSEINKKGSMIRAARSLGIPYSRVWDALSRIERVIGESIIEAFKGAKGGTKLTREGMKLLEMYYEAERILKRRLGSMTIMRKTSLRPDLAVAYSDDIIIDRVLERLSSEINIQSSCIGSGLSLALLSLEEIDIACIHLFDPETGDYNTPYIERFWLRDRVIRLGGFLREQVLAFRREIEIKNLDELFERILKGELRLASRNRGSGTRVYLEYLLRDYSRKLNMSLDSVSGLDREYYTHDEAVRAVIKREADVTLVPRIYVEGLDLNMFSAAWEKYECFTLRSRVNREPIKRFREIFGSDEINKLISSLRGYKLLEQD